MKPYKEYNTSHTLLKRACNQGDEAAWNEFVNYYQTFIYLLLCHMQIPKQECDDITQKALIAVWKGLKSFDPEKAKFRTWLTTVIRNTTYKHMKDEKTRCNQTQTTDLLPEILSDDKASELEVLYQKEWEKYVTSIAMKNIEEIFSGKAIEVFNLVLENCPPEQIAEKLDIHLHSVYNLKNRVKARLIKEVKHLRNELEL